MRNIVIAEKNNELRRFYETFFRENRFEPFFSKGLKDTLRLAVEQSPDFVILNLMRPKRLGLEICESLRAHGRTEKVPIIFVSAIASEEDRIAGFEAGCDDYLAIPFETNELRWRLKSIERRCNPPVDLSTILEVGNVVVDTANSTVHVQEEEVSLSPREYRLLVHLMRRKEVPQSRDLLLSQVWDGPTDGGRLARFAPSFTETRAVDVQVERLRKKLASPGGIPQVARNIGYVARETNRRRN